MSNQGFLLARLWDQIYQPTYQEIIHLKNLGLSMQCEMVLRPVGSGLTSSILRGEEVLDKIHYVGDSDNLKQLLFLQQNKDQ